MLERCHCLQSPQYQRACWQKTIANLKAALHQVLKFCVTTDTAGRFPLSPMTGTSYLLQGFCRMAALCALSVLQNSTLISANSTISDGIREYSPAGYIPRTAVQQRRVNFLFITPAAATPVAAGIADAPGRRSKRVGVLSTIAFVTDCGALIAK